DGMMDVWFIARSGTTTGATELHIMDGNGFDRWLKHEPTALADSGTGNNWSFVVGNFDSDETPDVAVIARESTGSGRTEIHILNGKRPHLFISHSSSGLHEVGTTFGWDFT